jgi:WD40 repeat protein/HEAT repeat protein
VAFTPDGKTLVRTTTGRLSVSNTAGETVTNGVVELWDIADGKKLRALDNLGGFIHAAAVSPDGLTLAVAVGDVTTLYRLDSNESRTLPVNASSLAFSPDGTRLLTATPLGVKLWDVVTGRDFFTLGGPWSRGGNTTRVGFAAPDGYLLVSETDGLRVYDGRPWTPPPPPPGATPPTPALPEPKKDPPPDTSPEPVKLAVKASVDAMTKHEAAEALLHAIAALEAEPDPERQQVHRLRIALAWQALPKLRPVVPPGSQVPSGFAPDKVASVPFTPNVLNPLHPDYWSDHAAISSDGKRVAKWNRVTTSEDADAAKMAGGSPWRLRVYDVASGQPVGPEIDIGSRATNKNADLSFDGKRVAVIAPAPLKKKGPGDDEEDAKASVLRVWETETGRRVGGDLPVPFGPMWQVYVWFEGSDRFVIVKDGENRRDDRTIVFDLTTGKPLGVAEPFATAFGATGGNYLVTSPAAKVRGEAFTFVRDVRTLQPLGKPLPVRGAAAGLVTPDGKTAVLGDADYLGAWDLKTGERRHGRIKVGGGARRLEFHPDGTRYAAAYGSQSDTTVQMFDLTTGAATSPGIRLDQDCRGLWFTPDGRALVTVTQTDVRVWDARTGAPITPVLMCQGADYDTATSAAQAGDTLLARRSAETSCYNRWQLTPDPRPVAELKAVAEAVTGRRRDANGSIVPIEDAELLSRRKEAMGRAPVAFGPPIAKPEQILTAHPNPRVPQVMAILADQQQPDAKRASAASVLGDLKAAEAQPVLVKALRTDPDSYTRQTAAVTLDKLDPLEPATVAALLDAVREDKDNRVRGYVARSLRGAAKQVPGDLVRILRDDKAPEVRAGAAYALRNGPADNADAIAALRAASADGHPWPLRVEAAASLAKLLPADVESVKVLVAAADQRGNAGFRYTAVKYLYDLGPRAAPALPALMRIVQTRPYQQDIIDEGWYAVQTLARIGPAAKEAMPLLLARLHQDDSNPHRYSGKTNYPPAGSNPFAYTIACMGPDAVPELLKIVRDADAPQRWAAALAISPFGPVAIPAAVWQERFEDVAAKRRRSAVLALGYLGPPAKDALPDLESLKRKIENQEEKSRDDEWLEKALERAITRIRDPKALPVEQMDRP